MTLEKHIGEIEMYQHRRVGIMTYVTEYVYGKSTVTVTVVKHIRGRKTCACMRELK